MSVNSATIFSVVQSLSALRKSLSADEQVILDSVIMRKSDADEVVAHSMENAAVSLSVASQVQPIAVNTSVIFGDEVVAHGMEKDQADKHVASQVIFKVIFDAEKQEYAVII